MLDARGAPTLAFFEPFGSFADAPSSGMFVLWARNNKSRNRGNRCRKCAMPPMKVDVSTELDCSAAKVWNEVQKSALLLRVILAARAHKHIRSAGFAGALGRRAEGAMSRVRF